MVSRASSQVMRWNLPSPLAPAALERVLEPVGGVDELRPGETFGAQRGGAADAGVEGGGIALHPDEPAVFHMAEDAAGGPVRPTAVAEGGDDTWSVPCPSSECKLNNAS